MNKDLPNDEDNDTQRNLDFDNDENNEDDERNISHSNSSSPLVPCHQYFTRFKDSMSKFSGTVMASVALVKLKAHVHSPNSEIAQRIFRRIRSFCKKLFQ